MTSDKTKIRNAATVIVVRNKHDNPSVLMGQRGVNAAFMPSKFVFPGGAVDDQDLSIDIRKSINEVCKNRLCLLYTSPSPRDAHESRMPSSA